MEQLANNVEERSLFRELVKQIFIQLPAALFALLLLSLVLVLVLWHSFAGQTLLIWLAAVWAVSLARFVLYYCFRKYSAHRLSLKQWLNLFSVGVVLTGISWGAAGALFYSEESPQTNVFIAFVLGGLIAGAASSLAAMKVTMRLFTAMLLLPIITIFLVSGDNLQVAMGFMLIVFGGAYMVLSANMGRMIVTSLRLRSENLREIGVRTKAELELRQIKEGLEKTVDRRTGQLKAANEDLSREVAERRQAEARLKISEERYRNLVESTRDWIWEVDDEGAYTYSSPSVESLLGYTTEEIAGQTFYMLMPPDEAERTRALFEENKTSGMPIVSLVNRCLHKNGSEVVMETNGEPIFDDSGVLLGYRGIDRDITPRIRHEEETRRFEHLHSLGLLAGGIAHDFNNLLTAVFGNIELARLYLGKEANVARPLDEASAAIGQAKHLTGQLLTFSKGGRPVLETASVRDLILDTCRFALSGTAVKCEFDLSENLWMATLDQGQIWQVLNNILTNARESMSEGGEVWITAENAVMDESATLPLIPGKYIRIAVRDRGVGISKTDLPRVFDPYFTTKKLGTDKGTGIGLAVCHSVIEKHGGHIVLDSRPGDGTTVTLYLPASGDEPDPGPAAPAGDSTAASRRCRVMVLEDDKSVISTISRIFYYLGHTVEVAEHGVAAVELYTRNQASGTPFDIVFLDLTIRGGLGGRETIKKLKKIDPAVIAVVISGYADDPVVASPSDYGFHAALVKPFNIKALRGVLEDLLRQ